MTAYRQLANAEATSFLSYNIYTEQIILFQIYGITMLAK